ncbi:phage portal protein [Sphingomonas nostoxanthinifaciens]|uniref:phage portal protein n=1 Tax=Sphingomonas nostoxanthinifaciens TaxID=2872652 RepID=UPI001CC1E968|nr:phage portal protein [Sphingomonas nostoxanthinifaciens]UAK25857.1 phage portal protein [Sphingomonas nostoxanthinifaciens]
MSIFQVVTGWLRTGTAEGQPAKLDGPKKILRGDGGTYAAKPVTPETTLTLSAAWACTRLNARTIGSLPLKLFRRTSALERAPAEDHPLYDVLANAPNPDQDAMEFWEGQITALNLRGNAYARIGRRGDGNVVALWPIYPDAVTVYRDANNERRYRVWNGRSNDDLPESEIFHLRGFGAGGDMGLSPISFGRQTLGTALAAEEVAGTTFANGLQLSGFVEDQQGARTTQEQREQLVELFKKFAGSTQTGKVMPLPPGMRFSALGMSPEDAQLLDTRRFSVEDICRWFGVFPILIGHASQGQTMWGSGIEQLVLSWLTLGLGPELTRIEGQIRRQLLRPVDRKTYYAEHIVEGLLRADSAARAALYSSLGQNGVMKRNEMRAKENLPRDPSPGADMLTVQSNLIPVDQLGHVPAAASDQVRSGLMNLLFGGDIDALVDARVKAAMMGHNGGPRLED